MIKLLICILLISLPVQAAGEVNLYPDVKVLRQRRSYYYSIPVAPPGHEADVCSPAVLAERKLNSANPFLFSSGPEWLIPFYVVSGKPWATKLELINYGGGNTDYNGFPFRVEFIPTAAVSTTTLYSVNVTTIVIDTIVGGVSSVGYLNYSNDRIPFPPYGFAPGTDFPLPADWQTTYSPVLQHGDDTDGQKAYEFTRPYILASQTTNYPGGVPVPLSATVVATEGFLEISMTAEQTAAMANWHGNLRVTVIRPAGYRTDYRLAWITLRDQVGRYLYTESEQELLLIGTVSSDVALTNESSFNSLPMIVTP